MRQGCLMACTVMLLLLATAGGAILWFLFSLGVFESYPPPPQVETFIPPENSPSVYAKLDFTHPVARDFIATLIDNPDAALTSFVLDSLPYELAFTLTPAPEQVTVHLDTTVRLRRLSGVLKARSDTEIWRWFKGQKITEAGLQAPGLWRVRSELPMHPQIIKAGLNNQKLLPAPITIWPSHPPLVLAVSMNNEDGGAYLAIEPLLNPQPQPGERPTRRASPSSSPWAPYFLRIKSLTASVGLDNQGGALFSVDITARDTQSGSELLALLELQRDLFAQTLETHGGWLEGQWRTLPSPEYILGSFQLNDAAKILKAYLAGDTP